MFAILGPPGCATLGVIDSLAADRRALLLGFHAAAVGIGWVPVLLAFMLSPALRDAGRSLPEWFVGGSLLVGVGFAVPLLWPLFLAIGWFEANLAERIGHGEHRAAVLATRVLMLQGVGYLAVALVALAGALVYQELDWWAQEGVRWAWVVPFGLGVVHVAMARFVRRPPHLSWVWSSPGRRTT
ncbi:MAG: hypothetical protein ACR2KK_12880 [Acidimicrobiales bacterium]